MSKGALLFAHNNTEIDYVKIAACNALMIKSNLGVNTTLVTDAGTHNWAKESLGEELLQECFEQIIEIDHDYVYSQRNPRIFRDTSFTTKQLPFYNCDHWMAYELSPYDETLFIDADYLIMSDALNNVWGSDQDIMINHDVEELMVGRRQETKDISEFSIRLYWATCIYFKKSELAENTFMLVKHIYDNYQFYRQLYQIPRGMFRNDFAFSIAVHMMNGFYNSGVITQLPIPAIHKSFDNDDILSFNGKNDMTLLLEKPDRQGEFIATRVRDLDVHIMNKWAVLRNAERIIETYRSNDV